MPRHITPRGHTIGYHPIIIRFTCEQITDLQKIAKATGDSISGVVRSHMQRRIDDFKHVSVLKTASS